MFSALIKELIELQETDIQISINSEVYTIYFCLGLVLGNNLGLNSILGFVESFLANFYCRMILTNQIFNTCLENTMIRNKTNYIDDLRINDVSQTGINEFLTKFLISM